MRIVFLVANFADNTAVELWNWSDWTCASAKYSFGLFYCVEFCQNVLNSITVIKNVERLSEKVNKFC